MDVKVGGGVNGCIKGTKGESGVLGGWMDGWGMDGWGMYG